MYDFYILPDFDLIDVMGICVLQHFFFSDVV